MSSVPPQTPSNPPPGQPPPYPPPQPGMDPRDYARAQKDYYRAWKQQQKDNWRANRDQWKTQRNQWRERAWYGRRRSLVGPMMLIAIGIVFLLVQTGHMESWRAWEWFGHWWPVILIAAGIGRLIEWMMDRDSPYPPRSSGFVGLLILIIIVGCIATGLNHAHTQGWGSNWNWADDSDFSMFHGPEHDYDGQFWAAVPAGDSLQIVSSVRGDLAVTTSDAGSPPPPAPGEVMNLAGAVVYIRLHKKVHSNDEQKAKREADAFVPVVTHSGNITTIHIDPKSDEVGANLEVVVPADVTLAVETQHGDVSVTGVKADVSTNTHHGDLRFADLGGNLSINIDHGDLAIAGVHGNVAMNGHFGDITISNVTGGLSMSGDFPGDLDLRSIDGPLQFHSSRTDMAAARIADQLTIDSGELHGAGLVGPFSLKTRDFNVDLSSVSGDVDITNTNNEVDVVAARPLGSINIDNHSGNIRVTLPQDAGFQLDAETSGEISDDFGVGTTEHGEHKTALGTVGNGALRVTLKSNENDISIRKASDAPSIPPPGAPKPPDAPGGLRIPQPPAVPGVPTLKHLHPPAPPKIAVPQPPEISNQ